MKGPLILLLRITYIAHEMAHTQPKLIEVSLRKLLNGNLTLPTDSIWGNLMGAPAIFPPAITNQFSYIKKPFRSRPFPAEARETNQKCFNFRTKVLIQTVIEFSLVTEKYKISFADQI